MKHGSREPLQVSRPAVDTQRPRLLVAAEAVLLAALSSSVCT